jgi:hypothetical protein
MRGIFFILFFYFYFLVWRAARESAPMGRDGGGLREEDFGIVKA